MSTEYRVYELKAEAASSAAVPPRPGKIVRVALAATPPPGAAAQPRPPAPSEPERD